MKHSSSSRCCCFCCCFYFWLTMLLVATSVVHVSPESSTTTTNMHNQPQPASPTRSTSGSATMNFNDKSSAAPAATTIATSTIAADMMTIMMKLSTATQADVLPQIAIKMHNNSKQQQEETTSLALTTATPTSGVTTTHTPGLQSPFMAPQAYQAYQQHWSKSLHWSLAASNPYARSALHTLARHPRQADAEQSDKCRLFIEGETGKNELYSPDYPNDYPKNINCTRVITAPKGQIIRLDFRNSFHIEAKEECKFDFLEIRDGQYGFSNLIGKYCGTDFPPEITSKERYLWLHFHSDESIEYSGFTAVYEFLDRNREAPSTDLNCTIEKDGFEGFINSSDIPQDIRETVIRNRVPLDCMWRIQVQEKWKIQVKFLDFKLSKPNDCETNFLDIFPEQTVMPLRVKNFCGSAGEGITSDSNILHIRFYAEQIASNSTFAILYTAFRDKGSSDCTEDEYDCEDATCISKELKCNNRDNCKFRWDEEGCATESAGQSEHVIIIIIVFGLILGGMVVTFLVNCVRKIMRDQKIIREHIRQSKESKLDEMGRLSKARSRENISATELSPRQKHSQTSLQILDDVSSRYYREAIPISASTRKADSKEKEHHILRHHNDMIVQKSLCSVDETSTSTSESRAGVDRSGATVKACDMGCQTRESLFGPGLMRQKSISSSIREGDNVTVPPPPRFSTFGYEMQQAPSVAPASTSLWRHSIRIPHKTVKGDSQQQATHQSHQMLPRNPQEICHHHHQHQQHLQQQQQQQQQRQNTANPMMPQGQRSHHQQHAQHHASQQQPKSTAVPTAASGGAVAGANKSKQQKVDESKVFIDIRNSAPDVIIMTSH